MTPARSYSPKQDPFYHPDGDDELTVRLTREAGTDQWDCTVYVGRYREVVQLWTRQSDGTLRSKFYGLKMASQMRRWTRVQIPSGTGDTALMRAALLALRDSISTEVSTERPDMDPLF
jgi:hypothetical protein